QFRLQLINGILKVQLPTPAYHMLKELLTNNFDHLKDDELLALINCIFDHLNLDDEDNDSERQEVETNHRWSRPLNKISKPIEFLQWLINNNIFSTQVLFRLVKNIIDLHEKHEKEAFHNQLQIDLLMLVSHLANSHNAVQFVSLLCAMILKNLETDLNSAHTQTMLIFLTPSITDIRQQQEHKIVKTCKIQLSLEENSKIERLKHQLKQLPICWLTILHKLLLSDKTFRIRLVLLQLKQFLQIEYQTVMNLLRSTTNELHIDPTSGHSKHHHQFCALSLFDMTSWKLFHSIMEISFEQILSEQTSTDVHNLYDNCLSVIENLSNILCCIPNDITLQLYDIKRLLHRPKTSSRENMINLSINHLQRLIRPKNSAWKSSSYKLIDHILFNPAASMLNKSNVLKILFSKYRWFYLTPQFDEIIWILFETVEKLLYADCNKFIDIQFEEYVELKLQTIQLLFDNILNNKIVESNMTEKCYSIINRVFCDSCNNLISFNNNNLKIVEKIINLMCKQFKKYLVNIPLLQICTLQSKHSQIIMEFLMNYMKDQYSNITVNHLHSKLRSYVWQHLLNIRLRSSDKHIGYAEQNEKIVYSPYLYVYNGSLTENVNQLNLDGYLENIHIWLKEVCRTVR
ncbi:unnamed protein product, partial [Didymodactylos carnosus]